MREPPEADRLALDALALAEREPRVAQGSAALGALHRGDEAAAIALLLAQGVRAAPSPSKPASRTPAGSGLQGC